MLPTWLAELIRQTFCTRRLRRATHLRRPRGLLGVEELEIREVLSPAVAAPPGPFALMDATSWVGASADATQAGFARLLADLRTVGSVSPTTWAALPWISTTGSGLFGG